MFSGLRWTHFPNTIMTLLIIPNLQVYPMPTAHISSLCKNFLQEQFEQHPKLFCGPSAPCLIGNVFFFPAAQISPSGLGQTPPKPGKFSQEYRPSFSVELELSPSLYVRAREYTVLREAWVNGLVAVGSLQYKCTSHYGTQKGRRRQGKKVAVLELAPLCLHKYFKDHNICISCLEDKPKDLIRAWGKRVDQQSTLQSTLCPQYPSVMLGRVRDSVISNSLFLFLLSKWLSFQGGLLMTQILETKFEGLDFQYSDGIQLWSVQLR